MFGSSGYRAVFDRNFLDVTFRFGLALGSMAPNVLVGMDTRTSSPAVKHSLISGLLASGARVFDGGIIPTPTLAYRCRDYGTGVMITASHNPPEYNGLKPWNADGSAFDAGQRQKIEQLIHRDSAPVASWEDLSALQQCPDAVDFHSRRILEGIEQANRIKVVIDCGGGAGSFITPQVLAKMGCEVVPLNCVPTGVFPRNAEPTESSLRDLSEQVRASGADLGLAHDVDADRLVATDETGRLIPGDKLMVLLARQSGARRIVTTVDASMAVEDSGLTTIRTPVGDAFVSEQIKLGGDFGGEACGAWIFPSLSFCPDGIYAAAQVVRLATQGKLSEQAASIPSFPIRRGSLAAQRNAMPEIERFLVTQGPRSIDRKDGIRASFDDGWLLVRPSGTEPKVRITAEARTESRADNLFDLARKAVSSANEEPSFMSDRQTP